MLTSQVLEQRVKHNGGESVLSSPGTVVAKALAEMENEAEDVSQGSSDITLHFPLLTPMFL